MNAKIQLVKTEVDYNTVLDIRRAVFIEEQNVPEDLEIENEDTSFHVLAMYRNVPAVSYTHLTLPTKRIV